MKKYLLILLAVLSCVIVSCDWLGCGGDPEIVTPTPEFVQLIAEPAIVPYGGNTVLYWKTVNTQYVEVNGEKKEAQDSLEFKNLITSTTIKIVAFGEFKNLSQVIIITTDQAPLPKLTVNSTKETIPYGDKTSFSWITEGFVTSVAVDGVKQSTSSFTTNALYTSTEYTITTIGPGGVITQKVSIPVGDWTTSRLGLLTYKPWMLKSMKLIQNGEVVFNSVLDVEQLTDLYYYSTKGEATVYHSNGIIFGACDWSFLENQTRILIGDQNYFIGSLTKNEFIRIQEAIYNGKPCIYEDFYYRP